MLVNSAQITDFIPQRAPFIMIDSLELVQDDLFVGHFTIKDNHLFLTGNTLGEEALIESIAQTCAAGFTYLSKQKGLKGGGLGFIGAVTKLVVSGTVSLNEVLKMEVRLLTSFDKIQLIEGTVSVNSKPILNCQMKIVTP